MNFKQCKKPERETRKKSSCFNSQLFSRCPHFFFQFPTISNIIKKCKKSSLKAKCLTRTYKKPSHTTWTLNFLYVIVIVRIFFSVRVDILILESSPRIFFLVDTFVYWVKISFEYLLRVHLLRSQPGTTWHHQLPSPFKSVHM